MIHIIWIIAVVVTLSCSSVSAKSLVFESDSNKDVMRFNVRTGTFWHPSEDTWHDGKFCSGSSGLYCYVDLSQVGFVFSIPIAVGEEEWSLDGNDFKIEAKIEPLLNRNKATLCPEGRSIAVYRSGESYSRYSFFYSKSCGVFGYCFTRDGNQQCYWSRGEGISLTPDLTKKENGLLLNAEQESLILANDLEVTDRSSMITREECLVIGKCR